MLAGTGTIFKVIIIYKPNHKNPIIMNYKKVLAPALVLALAAFFTGCDTTGTDSGEQKGKVRLQFKTVSGSTSAKSADGGQVTMAGDSMVIAGSNGTLQIDDVRFIVAKFKLEPADVDEEADSLETENEEFESEPFFVDLPLNEASYNLLSGEVEPGLYEELEFEVKDLDFDEEDKENGEEEDGSDFQALGDSIYAVYPEWPEEASMVITGTFAPTDGDPQPFKIFAKAEVEIEREFEPSLEINETTAARVVTVNLNPSGWLTEDDGTVYDLSRYDWDTHHELLEFSAKFKEGVEDIDVDDDDFKDEDDNEDDE